MTDIRPRFISSGRLAQLPSSPRLFLVLGCLALYLLVLGFSAASSARPLSLGMEATWDDAAGVWVVSHVVSTSFASDAGIRVGDRIRSTNGHAPAPAGGGDAGPLAGVSRVEVQRPATGKTITFDAATRVPNRSAFFAISLIAVLVAAVAFLWGHGSAPLGLAMTCYFGGLELAILPMAYGMVQWALVIHALVLSLSIASFAYLFLVFPIERSLVIGRWRFPTVAVVLSGGVLAAVWITAMLAAPARYPLVQRLGQIYILACLLTGSLSLARSWWHFRSGREGTQLRIAAFGTLVGILPFIVLSVMPRALSSSQGLAPELSILPIVLMPVSFAYAILRYQIMDLHVFLRRGLAYSVFAIVLGSLYAIVLFTVTLFARDWAEGGGVAAVAALSALTALAGERLRGRIQYHTDRLFDRHHYDYRRQLLEFSRRMSGIFDPDDLAHSAVELIRQTMGATLVRVYLFDPATQTYHLWTGVGIAPGADDTILGAHRTIVEDVATAGDVVRYVDVPPAREAVLVPLLNKGQPVGLLTLGPKTSDLPYSSEDLSLLRTVSNQLAVATENAQLYGRMRELYLSSVRTLAATVDAKDSYTHGHSERVAAYARRIAVALELPQVEIEQIELAGLLHDIGKIGIPDHVLQKPGRLDPEERAMIMEHPALGAKILAANVALMPLVPLVRHHHEWYNGGGYPDGLAGDDIPLGAAIISVADTYDTITTDRPYRKAPGHTAAQVELQRCSGSQFAPTVVAAFLRALEQAPAGTASAAASSLPSVDGSGAHDPMVGRISAVDARAMHIVYKIAQMIGDVTDLDPFLRRVAGLVRREIGAGQIDIYLVDEATGDLLGQMGAPGAVVGARIPAGQGVVGQVARTQRSTRVSSEQKGTSGPLGSTGTAQSELAVPLVHDGRTIGVISLESQRVGAFTEDDEALLSIVAHQLAQAIEVAQLHDQLKRSAGLDSLTGVANHRRFYERLEEDLTRATGSGETLSLLLLDVDGLKLINDTHGHLTGDTVLREVAAALQRVAGPRDTVARLGGDEFAIILPEMTEEQAATLAEQMSRWLTREAIPVRDTQVRLPSVSWGVASNARDGDRAVALVAAADERMYQRKSSHRLSRYHYTIYPG